MKAKTIREAMDRLIKVGVIDVCTFSDTVSDGGKPTAENGYSSAWHWKTIDSVPIDDAGASFGDFSPVKSLDDADKITLRKLYLMPRYCSGSDYSGDSVTVTNYRAWKEQFPADSFVDVYGWYGSYGIAIRAHKLTTEMVETLDSLANYPLLDDDLHSEIEREAENDAWDSWVKSDFQKELVKLADEWKNETEEGTEEGTKADSLVDYLKNELTDSQLVEWFYQCAEIANKYWIHETGNQACFRIDEMLSKCGKTMGKNQYNVPIRGPMTAEQLYEIVFPPMPKELPGQTHFQFND